MKKKNSIIYLGTDHEGFKLKEKIKKWLEENGYPFEDLGNKVFDSKDDYPIYALLVAKKVAQERKKGIDAKGILFCKSSVGMMITANKVKGIRAFSPFNKKIAVLSREHNNTNVIALSGEIMKEEEAVQILKIWLETEFSGKARHKRRLKEIQRFEEKKFDVIPGILENDFPEIKRKIELVKPFVKWVQIDFADGELVSNKNFLEIEKFSQIKENVFLEAHLMVRNPKDYLARLIRAGFKRIIAHAESDDIDNFLEEANKIKEIEVGLAVDTPSEIEKIFSFIDKIDNLLIMGVKAGFSGQEFLPQTLSKIIKARESFPEVYLSVDGGVNNLTAPAIVASGADAVVVNSYIFSSPKIEAAIAELKSLA